MRLSASLVSTGTSSSGVTCTYCARSSTLVKRPCWVSATVDGQTAIERLLKAGDRQTLTVRRDGSDKKLDLNVDTFRTVAAQQPPADVIWRKIGLRLQTISPDTVSRTNQQLHGGLTVMDVNPDGAAAKAGIQRGDILVGLHQWETLTLDNVAFVLTHPDLASFNPLRFYIVRSGQVHRGWLQHIE